MTTNTAPTFLLYNQPIITDFGFTDSAEYVAVQADGKVLVEGKVWDDLNIAFGQATVGHNMVRYNSDGSLDLSFGNQGILAFADTRYTVYSIAVQQDGRPDWMGLIRGVLSSHAMTATGTWTTVLACMAR
ncbi:hypothetical protein KFZ76_20085 [Methylovulum psychrotolerans]|uniref:delta-60 repeat domain-containing protein n=1 Tax=Methylovulum psychrotolerans TaxID=1704499 RepID=UPI001BFF68BC|nr:delta-60 repeat domain-containing protein [Methylovulum psychrotolerans]MBT9100004.1 hypothetical protein [Methylovulum psychrotolerans]